MSGAPACLPSGTWVSCRSPVPSGRTVFTCEGLSRSGSDRMKPVEKAISWEVASDPDAREGGGPDFAEDCGTKAKAPRTTQAETAAMTRDRLRMALSWLADLSTLAPKRPCGARRFPTFAPTRRHVGTTLWRDAGEVPIRPGVGMELLYRSTGTSAISTGTRALSTGMRALSTGRMGAEVRSARGGRPS